MPLISHDEVENFQEVWGNRIIYDRKGQPWSVIKKSCQHLDSSGMCVLYGTNHKPIQCENYPSGYQTVYYDSCKLMREKFPVPDKFKHLHEIKE